MKRNIYLIFYCILFFKYVYPTQRIVKQAGSLLSTDPRFVRPDDSNRCDYYYDAYNVTIFEDGEYIFEGNSSIDLYGCLYKYEQCFYLSDSFNNKLVCDEGGQFRINATLNSSTRYTLIITTSLPNLTGKYLITITNQGPYSVSISLSTRTTCRKSDKAFVIIFIIIFSMFGFCCIGSILLICGCYCSNDRLFHRRKKRQNQTVIYHTPPQAEIAVVVVQNNEIPLIIPVFSSVEVALVEEKSPPLYIEEIPPSYDSFCSKTMTIRL